MKKILTYIALVAVALIVIISCTLAGAWCWLLSTPGKGFLAEKINQTIPGTVAFKDVSVSLFKKEVLLKDVVVATSDGEKVLSFERLFVAIDTLHLGKKEVAITFELVAPDIALVQDEEGGFTLVSCFVGETGEKPLEEETPSPAEPFSLPINPIINAFTITRGHVVLEQPGLSLEVNDLSFSANGNYLAQVAEANLSVKGVTADMAAQQYLIDDMALSAAFFKGDLSKLSLSLNSPFGELALDGSVAKLLTTPVADLTLHVAADGERAAPFMEQKELVSGTIEADVALKGTLEDPAGYLKLSYSGDGIMGRRVKDVLVDLSLQDKMVTISAIHVDHEAGQIRLAGEADLSKALPGGFSGKGFLPERISASLHAEGNDLVPGIALGDEGIEGVHGTLSFNMDARLIPERLPELEARITGTGLGYQDHCRANMAVALFLENDRLELQQFTISASPEETLLSMNIIGQADLAGVFPDGPMEGEFYPEKINGSFSLEGEDLSPGQLLAKEGIDGIQGTVDLYMDASIVDGAPKATVSLNADNITAMEEEIRRIELALNFQDDRLEIAPLDIAFTRDHHLTATGWADMDRQFAVDIECRQLPLETFNAIRKTGMVSGDLALSLHAGGSAENPAVNGALTLSELMVKEKPVQAIEATVTLENQVARVDADLGFGAEADFDLTSKDFQAKIDFDNTALGGWLAISGVADLEGAINGKITADGNADAIDGIRAEVALDALTLVYRDQYEVSSRNIEATLQGKAFELSPLTLTLPEEAQLTIQGHGDMDKTVYARVVGNIPLVTAEMFTDQLSGLTGDIGLDVTAALQKDIGSSDIDAKIAFTDLGVIIPELGQKLHSLNGVVTATPDEVRIQDLAGRLDDGSFSVSGQASLKAFQPGHFDVRLECDTLPVFVPDTLEAKFSTGISWKGDLEASLVQGTVTLVSGLFTQDVKLENIALESLTTGSRKAQEGGEKQAEGSASGFLDTISLDITIKEEGAFVVSNNMAEMEIHPDITIGGKASNPSVIGRAAIDPGYVASYGKEFEISNGIIDFTNPYEIEPEIDVKALSTVRDWDITMSATGTPQNLIVTFSSDPSEEDEDILSLLVTGKTTDELISSEGGETTSPSAILAGVVASNLADKLRQSTGLDLLEIETGDDPASDINVTAGKELTENVTLKYGIETEDGRIVRTTSTEYKLTDNLTASGFQDTEGTFGGELRYRLEFR